MKMYKKSDLTLVNGMLVDKDMNVISVDPVIIYKANELETLAQKTDYLMAQPPASPMPTLDGFERQSSKDTGIKFNTTTPIMDAKMQEAMDLMDELDDVALVDKANAMLDGFKLLIEFAKNDYVVSCEWGSIDNFDMPTLGSILELTVEDICNVVALAAGMKPEGMSWLGCPDFEAGAVKADDDEATEATEE